MLNFFEIYIQSPSLTSRYDLGRQPANTKLSSNKTVRRVGSVVVMSCGVH
ncbi:hypothetical protein SOVF_048360 [Spinacia oleracea]|nr:hypothetical protein SOVF_048360 [Spinacia oleracea]